MTTLSPGAKEVYNDAVNAGVGMIVRKGWLLVGPRSRMPPTLDVRLLMYREEIIAYLIFNPMRDKPAPPGPKLP